MKFEPTSTQVRRERTASFPLTISISHHLSDAGRGQKETQLLVFPRKVGYSLCVSAAEIIEQIKSLPADQRAEVAKFVVENDDSWIPESFKQGMADAAAGRFANMETVWSGAKPPPRTAE